MWVPWAGFTKLCGCLGLGRHAVYRICMDMVVERPQACWGCRDNYERRFDMRRIVTEFDEDFIGLGCVRN